ncbi:acetylglutamate kinase [Anoxynatronum sibiricum]|uniref:Acetylglutamate kinase n=1 Tax=Anoxynatronum sibiricum TaxID=210623 RepID=A0ABU9VRY4_9CLOT
MSQSTNGGEFNPELLLQSLPYIQQYHQKIILIKYGGNAMVNEELKGQVIKDIAFMKYVGMKPVIMHGGGPEITGMMEKLGHETKFVNGLRVTDELTMEITEMVLTGKVAKDLVARLSRYGIKSIGISGQDGGLIKARQKKPELGFVGDVVEINPELVFDLLEKNYVPVISSIGCDEKGKRYNINADEAAGKMAVALGASVQLLLTDVQGVMKEEGTQKVVIPELCPKEIKHYIEKGVITGGMIPKVNCCVESVANGVRRAHIIDGRESHSLLFEIFSDSSKGTTISE